MNLVRAITTISGFTIASRIVGFFREMIMAAYLGRGGVADAFVVALKFPSIFRRILAEGAFNPAFVPVFAGLLSTEGKEQARSYAEEIFSIFVVILLIFTGIVELFMPFILPIFAPGFVATPERLELAISFTRITFPFIFLISITALYSGILNSMEKFAAVASSPMMGNMGIIMTVFLITSLTDTSAGTAFSIGIVVCGIIQLSWVLVPAARRGMFLKLKAPKVTQKVKDFFCLLGPAAAGSGVVQISILIDNMLASLLPEGGVSALHYADRLNQLPLSVLGTAMGTALLPMLSKHLRANRTKEAVESQNMALEYSLLLTLPATLGLIFLAFPMIKVLYAHGKFTLEDASATANTLMAFALGLPAYVLIKIFTTAFFARKDTKTPLYTGVFSVGLNVAFSLVLMRYFSYVGIALATALSSWVNVSLMAFLLIRKKQFELTHRLKIFLPRVLISCTLSGALFLLLRELAMPWIFKDHFHQIVALTLMVGGGVLSFFYVAKFLGALDVKELKAQFKAAV